MTITRLGVALLAMATAACGSVTNGGENAPAIELFTPDRGSLLGGTSVTLTGVGFDDGTGEATVVVGGRLASGVVVEDDTTITFEAPPNDPGTEAEITVFHSGGTGTAVDRFVYNNSPKAFTIDPAFSPSAGGVTVTVTGVGFESFDAGTNTITIGSAAAVNVQVVSDTEMTFETGPIADGAFVPLDVVVSNTNGSVTIGEAFKYSAQGLILTERPTSGAGEGLFHLDPVTLDVTEITRFGGKSLTGFAYDANDVLYAMDRNQNELLRITNPIAGEFEVVGRMEDPGGGFERVHDLLFVGGTLFGYSNNDRRLVTVDTTTAVVTTIGATPLTTSQAVCLAPNDDDSLVMVNKLDGDIDFIKVADSTLLGGGAAISLGIGASCHALAELSGTMFLAAGRGNQPQPIPTLFSIDLTTGAVTTVGQLPIAPRGMIRTPLNF